MPCRSFVIAHSLFTIHCGDVFSRHFCQLISVIREGVYPLEWGRPEGLGLLHRGIIYHANGAQNAAVERDT